MIVYAETSAVLRWLLGAPRAEDVRGLLAGAEMVFASRLTLIEANRALVRATASGEMTEADALGLAGTLATVVRRWNVVELLPSICERAQERFPAEPIRSLDALHLATALFLFGEVGPIAVLTTDVRLVKNAPLLGLPLALGT